MAVIAANTTCETGELLAEVLYKPELVEFAQRNKLNLSDNTVLIRTALINLIKNTPDTNEFIQYRPLILLPHEFDDFLKHELGMIDNIR